MLAYTDKSRTCLGPTRNRPQIKVEIKTTVHKRAEWREKLAAAP